MIIQDSKYYFNKVKSLAVAKDIPIAELSARGGRADNYLTQFKNTGCGLDTVRFWKRVANEVGLTLDELFKEL